MILESSNRPDSANEQEPMEPNFLRRPCCLATNDRPNHETHERWRIQVLENPDDGKLLVPLCDLGLGLGNVEPSLK